jgi:DNA processing protein
LPEDVSARGWPDGFVRSRADREALLVLAYLRRLLPKELHALAWRIGSACDCLGALREGIGSPGDRAIARDVDPRRVEERLKGVGGRFVTVGEEEYPTRLLDLRDPPAWLFVRGRSLSELGIAVAVVGARLCSPYGREASVRLGGLLAEAGVTVVSGAALGIDGAAHEGALAGGGHTVAVLGSGLDRPHPKTNRELIDRIALEGSVVTEYPPGAVAQPRWFPARNRIIAGLSQGVIVVEGATRSGSLQTAEFAGEDLNRQVMAVPGPIDSPLSEAPHGLIRAGAALVAGADDVLDALGIFRRTNDPAEDVPAIPPALMGTPEGRLLTAMSGRPASLEALSEAAALPLGDALVALSALELRGMIRVEGGRYRRLPWNPAVTQKRKDRQTSSLPEKAARARSAGGD